MEFEKARYEEQMSLMQTGKSDEEKLKKVQEIYASIVEMEEGRKYFEAELKFNVLLGDVNRIISEAVKDLLIWKIIAILQRQNLFKTQLHTKSMRLCLLNKFCLVI